MKSVILAAGMGTRMRPLTYDMPKSLVPMHGKPVLEYALDSLERVGVDECIIVVGYRASQIESKFGQMFREMRITYVDNAIFEKTNNIYSFWLAGPNMDDDILFLEGDLLFDHDIICDVLNDPNPNVAVVDAYQEYMDGTVIIANGDMAQSMVLKSQQPDGFNYEKALKTVNIYKFSQTMLKEHFLPEIGAWVSKGLTDQYYEAVLVDLIKQRKVRMAVSRTGVRRWAEVDTVEDLKAAERLFPRPPSQRLHVPISKKAEVG